MLGGLVQGLDLTDEQDLVAAGDGHAQDQLQEAGDGVRADVVVGVRGEIWYWEVAGYTVLGEVMSVVVEQHVEEGVERLQVRRGGFQHSSKPGGSEGSRVYLYQNLRHGQSVRQVGWCGGLEQSLWSVRRTVVSPNSHLGLEGEGAEPAQQTGDLVVHPDLSRSLKYHLTRHNIVGSKSPRCMS